MKPKQDEEALRNEIIDLKGEIENLKFDLEMKSTKLKGNLYFT